VDDARTVDADTTALLALAGAVAGVVVVTGLARSIPRTIAATAIAALIAMGLNPAVSSLERKLRLPRGAALGSVLAAAAIGVSMLAALLLPAAAEQVRELDDDIPEAVAELSDLPLVGNAVGEADIGADAERLLDELPQRLLGEDTPLVDIGRRAADGVVAATITLLLAIALLLDGRRLAAAVARIVPPTRRERAERLGDLGYRAVGRYVAGSLTVALVAGLFTLTVGLIVGVPLAPLLAMWVMVWNLIPQIGGAMGGIPFVAFAFTQGAFRGLICAALFVVYLQIENNVLGPLLVGSAVKLSPPATMVAALIGVSAGGVVGALLAVPVTGAAKAVYVELRGAGAGDRVTDDP
jgi:predicted PurR-regulated permease PerM